MLSRDEVLKIARLAKLSLTEKEIEFYQQRLGRILTYVEELGALATADTSVVRTIPKDAVAFREDRPIPFGDVHELLKNAPASEADSFLLPQVME
jgi:aspartyl-tRNA(Asn)/glutamyl-tRNA(Gln) amidotransferase subunit C